MNLCKSLQLFSPRLSFQISARLNSSNSIDPETKAIYSKFIRVDHAGELGADRIYAGQMAVLGKTDVGPTIQHMWDQEKEHLQTFTNMISEYRVRPTVLHPIWNVAGFVLGAGTAMLGKEAAMACTVAVEESITDHYNKQLRTLLEVEDKSEFHETLMSKIQQFRDEEMEHHDTGLEHGALNAPAYQVLKQTIQVGCTAAIWLSERI
uniref:5-demethoxyubiquinone hydroxylase, mitochondrial n=1 Tax=Ciona savignyi TaxID=51511 RepID=H2YVI5_CIOSA